MSGVEVGRVSTPHRTPPSLHLRTHATIGYIIYHDQIGYISEGAWLIDVGPLVFHEVYVAPASTWARPGNLVDHHTITPGKTLLHTGARLLNNCH